VPGDPEEPDPEAGRVAAELVDLAGRVQPGLGCHVLGRFPDDDPQIAQDRRVERPPELRDAGLVPRSSRVERGVEGAGAVRGVEHSDQPPVTAEVARAASCSTASATTAGLLT